MAEEEDKYHRPTWDEYFMEVARAIAKRSTCDRGRLGCVIVRDNQILATGYAGSPAGLPHCDDVGHLMRKVLHDENPGSLKILSQFIQPNFYPQA